MKTPNQNQMADVLVAAARSEVEPPDTPRPAPSWRFDDMTLTKSVASGGLIVETDKGKTRTFRGLRARLVRALLYHAKRGWAEANALRAQNDDLAAAGSRAVRERDEAAETARRLTIMRDRYANQVRAVELAIDSCDVVTTERIREALRGSR